MFTEIAKFKKTPILPGYQARVAAWHLLIQLLWKNLSGMSPLGQSYTLLPSLKEKKKKKYVITIQKDSQSR